MRSRSSASPTRTSSLASLLSLVGALLVPCALAAQAPDITPAGDPSVRSDSIYALAADTRNLPKDLARYSTLMLLDDGVVRVEADGRHINTFRQVAQVLKEAAADGMAERRFTYNPERETLRINWMRVLSPDGKVVSDKPSMSQVSDVPAQMANPLYQLIKVQRYSLTGVERGSLIDVSWTIEEKPRALAGDFFQGWNVTMAVPVRRSRFLLDVPVSMTPRIVEQHLDFSKQVTEANGRRVYLWARRDIQPPRFELFAPDTSIATMSVRVAAPLAWSDIGRWYAGLARDRYTLGPRATAKVDSVVRTARTRADTLRTLHRWIAKELRYVGIELGMGGYQPRMPDSVVATGFGDCKDKATLFIAAARHLGITAYPVLLNARVAPDTMLPAVEQFNHEIAAIPDRSAPSGYLFADLTTVLIPPTPSPVPYRERLLLVVLPDGGSAEVTLPRPTNGEALESRLTGELKPDGTIAGRYTMSMRGGPSAMFAMQGSADSAARAGMARAMARALFAEAKGDSVAVPDTAAAVNDTATVRTVTVYFHGGEGARAAGPLMLFTIPGAMHGTPRGVGNLLERLQDTTSEEARGPRQLPIDGARLPGVVPSTSEIRISLPPGWKAQLPTSVSAVSKFGTYAADYAQNGSELVITTRLATTRAVYPKEDLPALVAWLKAIAADKNEYVVLEPGR